MSSDPSNSTPATIPVDHQLPSANGQPSTTPQPKPGQADANGPRMTVHTEEQGKPEEEKKAAEEEKQAKKRRGWIRPVGLGILVIGAIAGGLYYMDARHYEDTDDAFIDAHITNISPRIAGHVVKVYVNDNEMVKAGDKLVDLDPADFKNAIEQAQADLDAAIAKHNQAKTQVELIKKTAEAAKIQAQAGVTSAQAGIKTAEAGIAQAEAQVTADEATSHKTDLDLVRYQNLLKTGDVTQQQVDTTTADAATAKARLLASQKAVASAQAQLEEAKAKVAQAEAQYAEVNVVPERTAVSERDYDNAGAEIEQKQAALDQAKLNLGYTTITAPVDGRITKRNVEVGHYVDKGEAFFALVPNDLYVTANFKEIQLQDMQPGQDVTIRVDAYPDQELHGKIDSLQKGTGSRFSMIPPENATGNFVKVVQRVPVKITFEKPLDSKYDYSPGMSVEPKVKVR